MKFDTINEIYQDRSLTDVFLGYNHQLKISDGEFYDMKNMSSDNYPILSPRQTRGLYPLPANADIKAMEAKDSLCYINGTKLYVNDAATPLNLNNVLPKKLISMGAYIIVMPDKLYYNTADPADYGSIEALYKQNMRVTFTPCLIDGNEYTVTYSQPNVPEDPQDLEYWVDTSETTYVLKRYTAVTSMWVSVPTTYVKIQAAGIAADFKRYDGVYINNISETAVPELKDLNGKTSVLYDAVHDPDHPENDYLIVIGFLEGEVYQNYSVGSEITIQRLMPIMDFIVESNNRLWGCRYGTNLEGEIVNEIYASKLGDFKNWFCYMGLSTDSYAASCGTDGQWTGAISYQNYPLFFKENFLHKVYGNVPAQYQINSSPVRGVMKGAGDSLAIVNETVFYKSRNGICAYNGSMPSEISDIFGGIRYTGTDPTAPDPLRCGAVAGSYGNKYYIDMMSEKDGSWNLFVFDTDLKVWHKEDNIRIDQFMPCRSEFYFIDHADRKIKSIGGYGSNAEADPEWMVETGIMGLDSVDHKYISSLLVRLSLGIGSRAHFFIQYDSVGDFKCVSSITGTSLKSFSIPIRPKRCDHFRLRIEGKGKASIYSITKTSEQGSDQ